MHARQALYKLIYVHSPDMYWSVYFNFLNYIYLFMCLCEHMCHEVHVEVKDNLREWVLSFYPVGPRAMTQALRLGGTFIHWAVLLTLPLHGSFKWTCWVKILSKVVSEINKWKGKERTWLLLGMEEEKVIIGKRENVGRDIWEGPERTQPWAKPCEEREEKGEGKEWNQMQKLGGWRYKKTQ